MRISNTLIFMLLVITGLTQAHRLQTYPEYDFVIRTSNMTNTTISCIKNCIDPPGTWTIETIVKLIIVIILVGFSALSGGLILGLMGLDQTTLLIVAQSGTPDEKRYANAIIPIRKSGNYLLTTLILTNVFINAAISILFDEITQGYTFYHVNFLD
jgi:hypothetical protein